MKRKSLSLTLCDPWTVVRQASPSMGFSRQEYLSGSPFPSPGYLPDPGCRCQPAKSIRSRERARRGWERKLKQTTAKMGSRGSDTSPRRDTVWPLYSASYIYTGEHEKDKTVSIFLSWPIHLTKSHKKSWEHGNGILLLSLTPDNISLCMRSLSRTPGVCSK